MSTNTTEKRVQVVCSNSSCRKSLAIKLSDKLPAKLNVNCPSCKTPLSFVLSELYERYEKQEEQKANYEAPPKPQQNYQDDATQFDTSSCGWLVVHDENAHSQIFPLKLGVNIVGRKSPSKPCEVMIDTQDQYMSRNHCQVEVLQRGNGFLYVIKDLGSQNGVFINADRNSRLQKDTEVYLQNGDTVQIGRTKVVLKVPSNKTPNKESAHTQVVNSNYQNTVIL